MIDRYAKCLILVILAGWIMDTRECAAAAPFTPRHADPVQEFWRWRAFPELKGQGLSCLAQDRDGNFLFGTDNGIHRYDGTNWRVFPFDEGIVGKRINTLYVARNGSVYAGSDRGISQFENGTWERVFLSRGDYRWFTYDLTETEDGSLWAGTEWGALRVTPGGIRLYAAAEDTTGIRQIVSDAVAFVAAVDWWLYDDHNFLGGVVAFDGTNWTHHPYPSITSYAYGIGQSSDGTLWFGGKLVSFDGTRRVRFTGTVPYNTISCPCMI